MAKNCPTCGAPVEYDPKLRALVCNICGNAYAPEELPDKEVVPHTLQEQFQVFLEEEGIHVDSDDGEIHLDPRAEEIPSDSESEDLLIPPAEEVTGLMAEDFECKVYTCSQCGGEVFATDTEVSTRCVYCGSTAVIYNRISKSRKPDYILPFSITKEEAISNFKKRIKRCAFVPRRFKKLDAECVRGIYLPCTLFDGEYSDVQHHIEDHESVTYMGECYFHDLPVISCSCIDETAADALEPFAMSSKKPFDTSYLMGFYSNTADLSEAEILERARKRGKEKFNDHLLEYWQGVSRDKSHVEKVFASFQKRNPPLCDPKSAYEKTGTVMLPVWFITVHYENTPYTFLINGQTGEVSGTAPWNKKLIYSLMGLMFLACATLLTVYYRADPSAFRIGSDELDLYLTAPIAAFGVLAFGVALFKHANKLLEVTSSIKLSVFSRKRQGDRI
ncbi:MAG: hypothetical protein J5636_03485 [Clostridiales bacterium]|nr:hypothetical protein [Clostridiales bacterium]